MPVSAKIRRLVEARAGDCCEYCFVRGDFSSQRLSIDHIVPRSVEADDSPENLALACFGCNSHKSDRQRIVDPETGRLVTFYNPRTMAWSDHFEWSDDFSQIIGTSEVGRATVNSLQLNRPGVVNLRKILAESGLHPPA